jgi:hypothetical protein
MTTPQLPSDDLPAMAARTQQVLNLPEDSEIWSSLKQAIAASSGFQRWQLERNNSQLLNNLELDPLIRRYLRETLETLAY